MRALSYALVGAHPVSHAADRLDAFGAELLAQVADIDVPRPGKGAVPWITLGLYGGTRSRRGQTRGH